MGLFGDWQRMYRANQRHLEQQGRPSSYLGQPTAERAATLHARATVAKAYCSDALDKIAGETVQLHGGIAITWEHDAHLVLKRAHALGRMFGQAHEHRAQVLDT